MSDLTTPDNFDTETSGYILIAPLDERAKQKIHRLQNRIASALPAGSLWLPHGDQLHITFAHVITPEAEYSQDREKLFRGLEGDVRKNLDQIIPKNLCVKIKFKKIKPFKPAIILVGEDDGAFETLRNQFLSRINLPNETRRPPEIIHTTIARFFKPISFEAVESVVGELEVGIAINIEEIDLVHETKIYMQDHKVLERYPLQ